MARGSLLYWQQTPSLRLNAPIADCERAAISAAIQKPEPARLEPGRVREERAISNSLIDQWREHRFSCYNLHYTLPLKILRTPSVAESLNIFKACFDSPISNILDVGAQTQTKFLMEAFPDAYHYLFEPVQTYHSLLTDNYLSAGIRHEIIALAVSDKPGLMYQHLLSSDSSGKVTHSQLLSQPDKSNKFGANLLDIVETQVVSLDEWLAGQLLRGHYVLKIDVDGIEDLIIQGGEKTISNCSLLVVETHLNRVASRALKIQSLGMKLFDIVGNGYYFDQLSQVDLVFIHERDSSRIIDFRPWEKHPDVIWDRWYQY